jgi:hypothetical protein
METAAGAFAALSETVVFLQTPSRGQLGDIFATLDASKFQQCFVCWVASLTGTAADVIAIDGKTVRRSFQRRGAS